MNNEEKILSILEKVDGRMEKMEADIGELKAGQAEMRTDVERLELHMLKAQKDLRETKEFEDFVRDKMFYYEETESKRIQVAMDSAQYNQDGLNRQDRRVQSLERRADDHSNRISILEMKAANA